MSEHLVESMVRPYALVTATSWDEIELEVSGLGILRNRIVAPHVPVPPPFPIRIPV